MPFCPLFCFATRRRVGLWYIPAILIDVLHPNNSPSDPPLSSSSVMTFIPNRGPSERRPDADHEASTLIHQLRRFTHFLSSSEIQVLLTTEAEELAAALKRIEEMFKNLQQVLPGIGGGIGVVAEAEWDRVHQVKKRLLTLLSTSDADPLAYRSSGTPWLRLVASLRELRKLQMVCLSSKYQKLQQLTKHFHRSRGYDGLLGHTERAYSSPKADSL